MNYEEHPQKSVEPRHEVKTEAADVFEKQMKKIGEEVTAAMEKAVRDMKKYYDNVGAYMHKVNPNIFQYFLSLHIIHTYYVLQLQPHHPMPSCEQMQCKSKVHYMQQHGTVTQTST